MSDDRQPGSGGHDQVLATEIVSLVRRALANNDVRMDAIAEASKELKQGLVSEGLLGDFSPYVIRRPLVRAEKLLADKMDAQGRPEILPGDTLAEVSEALRGSVIEHFYQRLNASWSYIDVVSWEGLLIPAEMPRLFMLTAPLGKPHKGHIVIGEEHNQSGIHFHYAKLDGKRSDILFAFGAKPPIAGRPITWERHGKGKAKFFPRPDDWNDRKRENVNEVCVAARLDMSAGTRFYTPSNEARFLLPR